MSNPLWDYSLATYALDGVATSCLALQDTFGLDVNLLLYAAWLAQLDKRLSEHHLAGLEAEIGDWREQVIKPLRALRQQLQAYSPAAGVRDEIKALELCAEQQQQDRMFAYFQQTADLAKTPRPLRENLVLVAQRACPRDAGWEPSVECLVTQLPL